MSEIGRIYPFFKGRVALHAILKAAGIGEGDQVLLPGFTCVVVPNAVMYIGAQPVFLDIEPHSYNLDLAQMEAGLGTDWTPEKAKAIIVQHTFGIPCEMDKVREFAHRHGLIIIEDSCHSLGATWQGELVGTMGDAAFFSSQWSKPLTTGLGGWAQINNPELAQAFREVLSRYSRPSLTQALVLEMQYLAFSFLNHPRLFWSIQGLYRALGKLGLAIGSSSTAELECKLPLDYQKLMHPLQERRLQGLLRNRARLQEKRVQNSRLITKGLQEAGLPVVSWPESCQPILLRYPLLVENKKELLAAAKKQRIPLGDWFLSPVHPNENHWENAGYRPGTCPEAEWVSRRVVNISTDASLGPAQINRTIQFLARHAVMA